MRWEKITMPHRAGWHVDLECMRCLPATPLQYLERLDAANQVFDDDILFVGMTEERRILTSQPDIVGEIPTPQMVLDWMEDQGFEEESGLQIGAYDAKTFRRASVWLFDVRPMNFVERNGELYPIDVIVVFDSRPSP
jgi:hypothetical protein